jgi:hypothetical protein
MSWKRKQKAIGHAAALDSAPLSANAVFPKLLFLRHAPDNFHRAFGGRI